MNKIICIGSACKDIFFPTGEGKITETPEDLMSKAQISFELGAKYKIEERFESLGGCSANVASGLAKLGMKSACYAHIGDDYFSQWIEESLEKNGVDASLITKEQNCPSDLSAIVVDKNSGERVIFSNQKANGKMEIIPEKIKEAEWYFFGDLHGDWENKLDIIFQEAEKNSIKIAFNPRQANIHDNVGKIINFIPKCEILFLNKDEAIEVISGAEEKLDPKDLDNEKFLLEKLNGLGAKISTITDGLRGAWAYDGKEIFHVPGQKVPAVDSTGAGDAYSSGFLGAYLENKNLDECVRWGIANSSNVVQFYGGTEGLLNKEEIIKKAEGIEIEKV